MTKRWSSTTSDLTKTKRQASKEARKEAEEMARIAKEYGLDPLAEFEDYLALKTA